MIRKAALLGLITYLLSLPLPLWSMSQTITQASRSWWGIPFFLLLLFCSALPAAFFFTLYQNRGTLHIPDRLRRLARASAVVFGIITAMDLVRWLGSTGPYFQAMSWADPRTTGVLSSFFIELCNLAIVLLLIILQRPPADNESELDPPVSKPLRLVTTIAVYVGVLVLAFLLFRLLVAPYTYSVTRDYALQIGRTAPSLGEMLGGALRDLLYGACMFTVPYIIYRISAPEPSVEDSI
jgi:hypothetical protein